MPWWGWALTAVVVIVMLGLGGLVFLAKLFSTGDE
jgi:hypothetical protein